jgi:hypothetical protein
VMRRITLWSSLILFFVRILTFMVVLLGYAYAQSGPQPVASPISGSLPTLTQTQEPAAVILSAIPDSLTQTQAVKAADVYDKLYRTQPESKLIELMGPPTMRRGKGNTVFEEWFYPDGTIWLKLERHSHQGEFEAVQIKRYLADGSSADAPSKASTAATVATKVADVAGRLYLTHYCPQVYQKPVLLMTASDYQLLQACNANGFMLFGLYLYTGAQQ